MDESQIIEYKEIWKDEYLKWICGFANANGGRIFLGVDDDPPHEPVGLANADKLMEDVRKNSESYFADDFAEQWVNRQQTVEAIPVDWIEAQINKLRDMDNGFASLSAGQIEAMLKKWREEQNDKRESDRTC